MPVLAAGYLAWSRHALYRCPSIGCQSSMLSSRWYQISTYLTVQRRLLVCLLQIGGKVTYNGYGFDEFVVPRTAAYVDQNSNHIAELTVRETLDFAQRVQGVDYSACPHVPLADLEL